MKIKIMSSLALACILAASVGSANAQRDGEFDLNWFTHNTGGGSCSGGGYSLNATIAQPDAGSCAGGRFTLAGGFWPGVIEVGPTLYIAGSDGNVIISWPVSAAGFYLQHCTDLARPNWVKNTTPVYTFGDEKVVVESAASTRFYRLRKD